MTAERIDIPAHALAQLGPATIYRADARQLPVSDQSVDLIVTSPPYYQLRSYTDDGEPYDGQIGAEPTPRAYVDALLDVTRECVRVLKPSGSLWVNLGDKYSSAGGAGSNLAAYSQGLAGGGQKHDAAKQRRPAVAGYPPKTLLGLPWRYALGCIDELGLILRAEVIWSKSNGLPESVTDRVRRAHEHWFHFVLQPRYFAAVDNIRENFADRRPTRGMTYEQRKQRGDPTRLVEQRQTFGSDGMHGHTLGRVPGSVRDVPSRGLRVPEELGVDHPAAFPPAWPRWIIHGWCPLDGTVLDPFGGTGTTALAARALGRHGISVDLSSDYGRIAQWRLTNHRELAAARGVSQQPYQHADPDPPLFEPETREAQ